LKKLVASWKDARARHKERHRPTGFQFAIADSIGFLNPDHWDAVVSASSFFLQRRYLAVLEETGPEDLRLKCALIYGEGKPLAAIVAQILNVSGDRLMAAGNEARPSRNLLKRAFGPATKKLSAVVRERVLVCGNLLSWGRHGVAFAPGANAAELWPCVAEGLYRIRRAERLAGETNLVFVKDISPESDSDVAALRRYSYRPLKTDPDMVLTLRPEWRNYQDYLASLDGKYRKGAVQISRQIETAGCTVEILHDVSAHAARLHQLYVEVQDNAAVRPITLSPEYLPAIARLAGPDFKCVVIRRRDELLGFVTVLKEGTAAVGYYIGFDRAAAAAGLPLYLRLLHAVVAEAIEWKCQRLSLGRTALEPKARLGAKPEPMCVYLRHRYPAVNFFVRKLVYAIPHQEAPERSPFKQSKAADSKTDDAAC
jgi:hypothetical protein